VRSAVSVPSNATVACVPSQYGLMLDPPQRHSAQLPCSERSLSAHATLSPMESVTMVCFATGTGPSTR